MVSLLNAERKTVDSVRYQPHFKVYVEITEAARPESEKLSRRLSQIMEEQFGHYRSDPSQEPKVFLTRKGQTIYRWPPRIVERDVPFPRDDA